MQAERIAFDENSTVDDPIFIFANLTLTMRSYRARKFAIE